MKRRSPHDALLWAHNCILYHSLEFIEPLQVLMFVLLCSLFKQCFIVEAEIRSQMITLTGFNSVGIKGLDRSEM